MAIATHNNSQLEVVQHCMACVVGNEYGVISVTKLLQKPPFSEEGYEIEELATYVI